MQTGSTVNIELDKVYRWLCVNRLSLNMKKSKFMIFHSIHKKIPIISLLTINNIGIDKVTDFDFLGLTLNENMKWHSHINKLSTKISRAIGVIYKLRQYLPISILKTLYHSLVLPHLTYGIIAWHFYSDHVFKLQKKIVRIIANSSYNAHSEPLFKQLNLLKIGDIYKLNILKLYFKHCHRELPYYLQSIDFLQRSDVHQYHTRNKSQFEVIRTKILEQSIRYTTPVIINTTSPNILQKNLYPLLSRLLLVH